MGQAIGGLARGLVLLLAIGLSVGCAKEDPNAVRVDLEKLLTQETRPNPPAPKLPSAPGASAPLTASVPGLPPGYLSDPSRASESDVAASIEKQQKDARRELEKRLRAVYADQVRQFDLALRREVEGARPKAYDEANRKIRARFLVYADQRAPLASRLYDIVGFPDPNPKSVPPRRTLGAVAQRMFDEAVELRKRLATVEEDYQRDKNAILKEAEDALSEREADSLARIRELADRLERQAAQEAAAQVRVSVKDLGLQLTDSQPLALPGTPDRTVSIPGDAPFAPAPQVPSEGIPSGREDRRQRMERELRIWLGVNRYRLDGRARDATAEFQRWRESHRAGL